MMDTTIIYNDYLSGDAKALERLMEIYGDKLTLYINGYIKNLHDSEDLLIEVFAYLITVHCILFVYYIFYQFYDKRSLSTE